MPILSFRPNSRSNFRSTVAYPKSHSGNRWYVKLPKKKWKRITYCASSALLLWSFVVCIISVFCHCFFCWFVADNKLISILALKVEPEPHVIDQTFRFHQPEQSFLKKSIRLPPFQNMVGSLVDGSGYQQLVVRCSDKNVICESYKRPMGEPQDVFIKVSLPNRDK